MDIGVKRSPADALRMTDRRVVEVARLIGVMCMVKRANVTPVMLVPIIDRIQRAHDSLLGVSDQMSVVFELIYFLMFSGSNISTK